MEEITQASKAWAEAALALGREHEEYCECRQCEFAFHLFIDASGMEIRPNGGIVQKERS